jgi:hypothetical protein
MQEMIIRNKLIKLRVLLLLKSKMKRIYFKKPLMIFILEY